MTLPPLTWRHLVVVSLNHHQHHHLSGYLRHLPIGLLLLRHQVKQPVEHLLEGSGLVLGCQLEAAIPNCRGDLYEDK